MKPTHYRKAHGLTSATMGLYSALHVILGKREHANDDDRAEAMDELRAFHDWLGKTDAGHGLTAEPSSAFRAREEAGVSMKMDGSAIVIRVARQSTKKEPK